MQWGGVLLSPHYHTVDHHSTTAEGRAGSRRTNVLTRPAPSPGRCVPLTPGCHNHLLTPTDSPAVKSNFYRFGHGSERELARTPGRAQAELTASTGVCDSSGGEDVPRCQGVSGGFVYGWGSTSEPLIDMKASQCKQSLYLGLGWTVGMPVECQRQPLPVTR